jgi:hypothetical protein
MYHLPEDLIRYIYEYDITYREIFNKVLDSRYEIYQTKNTGNYFIFDLFSGKSFTTDSLNKPTWKTTHHTYRKIDIKADSELYLDNFKIKMMNIYDLEKVNENLQYNIHETLYP